MFDRNNVAIRITNIGPATLERDDAELTLLRIDCEVSPLTAELAAEIDSELRSMLFARGDGNQKRKVRGVSFDRRELGIKTQVVEMRMAPDQALDSFTLAEAEVSDTLKAKRAKEGPWTLTFSLTAQPASEHQSAQILESFGKTRYCNFEARQPDLFSPSTKKRADAVRAERAQGINPAAAPTAH